MPIICLDCRYIKPRPSGIAGVANGLVKFLPDLAPDWHFKLLRHASYQAPLTDARNVTEVVLRAETNSPSSMWFLPRLVDLSDVDLFHAPANILPRGLNMPCVTTIHDLMWLNKPQLCKSGPWGQVERHFYGHGIKRALNQSDAILTVSEATRADITAHRADLADTCFAHLPGIAATFKPREIAPFELAPHGLRPNSYILTVGQSAPYKNHEGALRGFAQAFANQPDMDLAFVQRQGSGLASLHRLAARLGVAERVHFLPPQSEEQLITLYCGAAALLHPSFCEGYGMPLAEAMACGCPVITSNISAMPEVTSGAALLVDPRDQGAISSALRMVVEEPDTARDMRQKGLERARQLDWQSFAAGNLEVYRKVLGLD